MKKVAYCPFNDVETANLALFNINKFHRGHIFSSGFDKRVRMHNGKTAVLKDVSYKQQIYVFGHGAPKSDTIEDCSGNSITIEELAYRLLYDGMNPMTRHLKLHSCSGGVGGGQSMAAKLKIALVGIGYMGITVYGYTEDLSTSTSGLFGFKRTVSGRRAKNARVQF